MQGDHFGEVALINNVRRTLAVRSARDQTQLLSLNRSTFTRILGSIKQFLKEDYAGDDRQQTNSVDGSFMSDNSANRLDASLGQQKLLFGIQEQEVEYEDPLSSDRYGRKQDPHIAAGLVQPQRKHR